MFTLISVYIVFGFLVWVWVDSAIDYKWTVALPFCMILWPLVLLWVSYDSQL